MENYIFDFIKEPSKDCFLKLRDVVINHPSFNPKSKDIEELEHLLVQEKYDEVINYTSINILLNPQAYFAKSEAHEKKQETKKSNAAKLIASCIVNGILDTGDGTISSPYLITRTDDEYIILMFLEEQFLSQELINKNDKVFDKIKTASNKNFYFEITHCYHDPLIFEIMKEMKTEKVKSEWWKFW